jgi:hypothetical protein
VQPARDERQGQRRRSVEPLRVVDQADQRLVAPGIGQETQHRQADEEPVGRRTGLQTERRRERLTLGSRQPVEAVEQRTAERMQAGVRQLHLGLDTGCAHSAVSGGTFEQVPQQLGLPDPRLTAQDEGGAVPTLGALQEVVESAALVSPPDHPGV